MPLPATLICTTSSSSVWKMASTTQLGERGLVTFYGGQRQQA